MQRRSFMGATAITLLVYSVAKASPLATIVDEKGKLLSRVEYIHLAPERIAIPVTAFQLFGLSSRYDAKGKWMYIKISPRRHQFPGAGHVPPGFRAGKHQIYSPVRGYLPERYSYPLALSQDGHFYISVSVMAQLFPSYFTYEWNARTNTCTLQRRDRSVEVW